MKIQAILKTACAPIALTVALTASPGFAQDAAIAEEPEATIIVTGSRIARPELALPNSVTVVDAVTIEQSGATTITDFLVNSPALLGSTTNIDVAGSNLPNAQLVGVNNLDLRNLGTSRTLVLVDGRRHVAGSPGSAAVDVNNIPADLIEKVEVLTGGASAIYGADGVTGVVNFLLKRNYEGIGVRGQINFSQRGDAGSRFGSIIAGKNFADGRGNITAAYEYNETDRFLQTQRLNYGRTGPSYAFARNRDDWPDDPNVPDRLLYNDLRWTDSALGGAIDLKYDPTDPEYVNRSVPGRTGEGGIYDRGAILPGTPFTVGGSSTPREIYYGDFVPYSRRHVANVMGHFEISPALDIYAEAKYIRSKADTFSQPTYDLYTYLAPDNAYLEDRFGAGTAPGGALFSRDNFDFGQRRYEMERELWRTVVGARGDLGSNLRYDLSYVWGQSTMTATNYGDRITDRYYAALDAVRDADGNITCKINLPGETTVSGLSYGNPTDFNGAPVTFQPGQCVPINILGNGSPSQAALDWVLANHSSWARITQHVVSGSIAGDTGSFFELPGGPIGFAVGAEYRKEKSVDNPSQASIDAILIDNSASQPTSGSFDVKEVFAEINLPLLADVPMAEILSVGGAIRLSDYSTIGSTTTWNVNGTYSPVRDIAFRGTYSQAVRAPNINELFSGQSGTFQFITDPCGIDRLGEGTQYRADNCAAALNDVGINPGTFDPANSAFSPQNSSLEGVTGGNPRLQEETARTWTAGIVLRPSFVPGLTLTADWYDIKLDNAIRTPTAQDTADLCYDQPTLDNAFCVGLERDPDNGFIADYAVLPQNVATYETAGLDINLQYRFEPFANGGQFNIGLIGNYLDKLKFVPSAGAEIEDDKYLSTYPAPEFSAMFDLTWTKGPVMLNYGINWMSKTRRVTREEEQGNPDFMPREYFWYKERWEHEIYVRYDLDDRFQFYGGINNLFDSKPDVGALAYPISAVGRAGFVGFRIKTN
ncbi:TonB-dependent receptor [Altererythrobacter xixiisoli]|uniref:TonB-dependent receptor n=1 Tax=Croceibacterium xixiisoli TaxID=1476466 RepID=A0A6I4TU84_9SPHN|nr:TonB-dependent receptor [Croceibacterium xixiisoli]MXO98138.1 TonB-dependent receptor [Croceibacterium xixiisoli]